MEATPEACDALEVVKACEFQPYGLNTAGTLTRWGASTLPGCLHRVLAKDALCHSSSTL